MHAGLDHNRFSVEAETARHQPFPQFETLLNVLDIIYLRDCAVAVQKPQPQTPQVEMVRILTQPIVQFRLSRRIGGIADFAALRVIFLEPEIRQPLSRRQRVGVPAPIRHRVAAKRLQPGAIESQSERAVANLQALLRVGSPQNDIVARHQCAPVDSIGFCRRGL